MAHDDYSAAEASTDGAMANYAVEIQFFDTADRPESQVTLPLMNFLDQNAAFGTSPSLGRWLK